MITPRVVDRTFSEANSTLVGAGLILAPKDRLNTTKLSCQPQRGTFYGPRHGNPAPPKEALP